MIRQLSICIICFCAGVSSAYGSLHVYVSKDSAASEDGVMVASADVSVYQWLDPDRIIKVLCRGNTGENGEPYTPKVKLPKA